MKIKKFSWTKVTGIGMILYAAGMGVTGHMDIQSAIEYGALGFAIVRGVKHLDDLNS